MRGTDWIPIPGTAKARLVTLALAAFGARGYEGVNVVELAAEAGVTTGALYHHFGNKLGLYTVVRDELERRVLDRMEGAAAGIAATGQHAGGMAWPAHEATPEETAAPWPSRADGTAATGGVEGTRERRAAVRAALLVGFDAALRQNAARLLSEPDPRGGRDGVAALLAAYVPGALAALAPLLAAAWRAALAGAAADPAAAPALRRALEQLLAG